MNCSRNFKILFICGFLFVVILVISQFLLNKYESFKGDTVDSPATNALDIKKTLDFKRIYNGDKYCVWEPKPIGEYYPIGHYLTVDESPPTNPAILIKSLDNCEDDKPVRYTVLSVNKDGYAVWRPEAKHGFSSVGHIFSKDYPSKHIIRLPSKEHVLPSNLKDKLVEDRDIAIWSVEESELFLGSNKKNSPIPDENPKVINVNLLNNLEPLNVKHTKLYTKIFEKVNKKMNKIFTVWRPIPPEGYVSLGDIATSNRLDPNNNIESMVVLKNQVRFPVHFNNKPICKLQSKEDNVSFWKPVAPEGYTCVGIVVNKGRGEPDSNKIIGCVPVEYIKVFNNDCNYSHKMIWNNLPSTKNVSVFTDKSHRVFVYNGLKCNNENNKTIDKEHLFVEKDRFDYERDAIVSYELNPQNTLVYDEKEREEFIKHSLKNQFMVSDKRFKNFKFNTEKMKFMVTVTSRDSNSDELTVMDLLFKMRNQTMTEPIKIMNKENTNHVSSLTYIDIQQAKNNKIVLDNSLFRMKNKTKNS
tara:strand:- start:61 stop:1641 length:1581 start_codon:yes stop_codon:yes gene_type:complete